MFKNYSRKDLVIFVSGLLAFIVWCLGVYHFIGWSHNWKEIEFETSDCDGTSCWQLKYEESSWAERMEVYGADVEVYYIIKRKYDGEDIAVFDRNGNPFLVEDGGEVITMSLSSNYDNWVVMTNYDAIEAPMFRRQMGAQMFAFWTILKMLFFGVIGWMFQELLVLHLVPKVFAKVRRS